MKKKSYENRQRRLLHKVSHRNSSVRSIKMFFYDIT